MGEVIILLSVFVIAFVLSVGISKGKGGALEHLLLAVLITLLFYELMEVVK